MLVDVLSTGNFSVDVVYASEIIPGAEANVIVEHTSCTGGSLGIGQRNVGPQRCLCPLSSHSPTIFQSVDQALLDASRSTTNATASFRVYLHKLDKVAVSAYDKLRNIAEDSIL
ncbi:hypothetical protein K439DRAFT_1566702 [Ramaria rubella]|nr:hypothetical protein K439DRAFT_1566702 [Ramaria rubella]